MLRKPAPKPDDPERSKRLPETARELEADESGKAFERAFKSIVPKRNPEKSPSKR